MSLSYSMVKDRSDGACAHIFSHSQLDFGYKEEVPTFFVVVGATPLLFLVLLLVKLYKTFNEALQGNLDHKKLLLPIFFKFIQYVTFLYATVYLVTILVSSAAVWPQAIAEFFMTQATLLVPMFILHNSLAMRARIRSTVLSVIVSAVISTVHLIIHLQLEEQQLYWVIGSAVQCFFFAAILVASQVDVCRSRLQVRVSLVVYAWLMFLVNLMRATNFLLIYVHAYDTALCTMACFFVLNYTFYVPVLYYTLVQESKHWRSMGWTNEDEHGMNTPLVDAFDNQGDQWSIAMDDIMLSLNPDRDKIGSGGFGEVFRARWKGVTVAVKKSFVQPHMQTQLMEEFEVETELMKRLRHPNIVACFGACMQAPHLLLVMEYMERGSLFDVLHNSNVDLDPALKLRMATDVARGMFYLHTHEPPIIHRDLKSPNLLVDTNFNVKVGDFGMAKMFSNTDAMTMTYCGTPAWTAPEAHRDAHFTVKADVYSFGITLWELLMRKVPFENMPANTIIIKVANGGARPPLPAWVHPKLRSLIEDCWHEEHKRRPSFHDILNFLESEQTARDNIFAPVAESSSSSSSSVGKGTGAGASAGTGSLASVRGNNEQQRGMGGESKRYGKKTAKGVDKSMTQSLLYTSFADEEDEENPFARDASLPSSRRKSSVVVDLADDSDEEDGSGENDPFSFTDK